MLPEQIMLTRLYADEVGETHFEDLALPTEITRFGSANSLSAIAKAIPVSSMTIREVREEGERDDVWHSYPRRKLDIFPVGLCEIEVTDGEIRRFGEGAALLLLGDDYGSRGHLFRPISGPRMTIFIDVPDDWMP